MNIPKIEKGYERSWVLCKQCKNVSYYDYVPYSLSNPIMTLPCRHGAALRWSDSIESITEEAALQLLAKKSTKGIVNMKFVATNIKPKTDAHIDKFSYDKGTFSFDIGLSGDFEGDIKVSFDSKERTWNMPMHTISLNGDVFAKKLNKKLGGFIKSYSKGIKKNISHKKLIKKHAKLKASIEEMQTKLAAIENDPLFTSEKESNG